MKTGNAWVLAGLAAAVVAGMAFVGCESTKTTDSVMTISPASVTLTNDYATVVFTASFSSTNTVLVLPLIWSVSNPERGTINTSGAMSALYQGTRLGGENTVTVRDQGDNAGTAFVLRTTGD